MNEHQARKAGKTSHLWRILTNIWSIVLFAIILEDFRLGGVLTHLIGPTTAIYVAILAIYSTDKEFERWHSYHVSRHPGEVYVALWTLLIFFILLSTYFTHRQYQMRPEVFSTYIAVLGIMAITRKSKMLFKAKRGH